MSATLSSKPTIQAALVSDRYRLLMQPKYFGHGRQLFDSENRIHGWMRKLCTEYQGGHWSFFETTNGGFFMTVDSDQLVRVAVADNYFEGAMTLRSAGITACLFAYADLHRRWRDERFDGLYVNLQAYARELPERDMILAAID